MQSYWGVEHGSEVSKGDKQRRHIAANSGLGALAGPFGAGGHAAYKGKKGRKTDAAVLAGGGALVGNVLGGNLGYLVTRGRPGGAIGGVIAGGAGGAYLGSVNNVQRGRIRGVPAQAYPMQRSTKRKG